MLHFDSGLMIHIIVNLSGCHGIGSVVQISVQTSERRVETPTLCHRAAACAGRWIQFEPGGLWCGGVVYEGVPPIRPTVRSAKMNFPRGPILIPQGLKSIRNGDRSAA